MRNIIFVVFAVGVALAYFNHRYHADQETLLRQQAEQEVTEIFQQLSDDMEEEFRR